MAGSTASTDGTVTGLNNHGLQDAWIIKIDFNGNIQWQKVFGGSKIDYASSIIQTTDGGYIFLGGSYSNDGDVSGNHGGLDLWIVKLDVTGNIQWQNSYGGSSDDKVDNIQQTSDGGYIVASYSNSIDGDFVGNHGNDDACLLKLDATGNIQWHRDYGGSKPEQPTIIIQTNDGGYLFATNTESYDGDVIVPHQMQDLWIVKLDPTGNIQWQKCFGGNAGEEAQSVAQTNDGGYIIGAISFSTDIAGAHGGEDGWVLKIDGSGNLQWTKCLGGSGWDQITSVKQTPDFGYVVAGATNSSDGDVCLNNGDYDFWLVKLDNSGTIEWQKTYGGSNSDMGSGFVPTTDGGFIMAGQTLSNDGDVVGNHGNRDAWVLKVNFPGVPLVAKVSIISNATTICKGKAVEFIATPVLGGQSPSYQWQVNGIPTGNNSNSFAINTLNDGDVVNCVLESSLTCIDTPRAVSNNIVINIDPSQAPVNFLPPDTAKCSFGTINIEATQVFNSYLWSNNDTTASIAIKDPGVYWLQVRNNNDCIGRDTIVVKLNDCLYGFYIPNAFTPNGDGKNDLFRPQIFGDLTQYKFTIYNRWGQIVFETTELNKGWDGTINGQMQNSGVYVWECTYELDGVNKNLKKGTVMLIR
ncbi:MAG TPA: gliding motility-associated C-terminal domain-containing protein [Chitinophagaceae bacterium]|nr:gliding motility-associated C-terminal domain-containing protein [Chitinophagaceae bacterium]